MLMLTNPNDGFITNAHLTTRPCLEATYSERVSLFLSSATSPNTGPIASTI